MHISPWTALLASVTETSHDLAELAGLLPDLPAEGAEATSAILDRLAEECAEAAAMLRSLPRRPAGLAGYTYAAVGAVTTAVGEERDFGGWLASVLCRAACRLGSTGALTSGRPGGWEATHVNNLTRATCGWDDENLANYREAESESES